MSTSPDADLAALHDRLRGIKYYAVAEGKRICEGIAPLVLEHTTASGRVLAVKISERGNITKSEADMSMSPEINTCSWTAPPLESRHLTMTSALCCNPWYSCAQGSRLV